MDIVWKDDNNLWLTAPDKEDLMIEAADLKYSKEKVVSIKMLDIFMKAIHLGKKYDEFFSEFLLGMKGWHSVSPKSYKLTLFNSPICYRETLWLKAGLSLFRHPPKTTPSQVHCSLARNLFKEEYPCIQLHDSIFSGNQGLS